MTDHHPLIRDAYQEDSLTTADRDRLWNTMQHRQVRQVVVKLLIGAGLLLLAAVVIAYVFLRVSASPSNHAGPFAVTTDSIPNVSPVERSMSQEPNENVLPELLPLLGHRSQLRMDMQSLEQKQLELAQRLERVTGREHQVVENQLASVEQQIEATRVAISVIDAQLSGQPQVVTHTATAIAPPQVFVSGGGGLSDEFIWANYGSVVLIALLMVGVLGYMRRIARVTREAMAAIERQVSSQHATLASGIDAIAVEVERLGEGQRFMSKALAGAEKTPAR
jgi:hypothetical protein